MKRTHFKARQVIGHHGFTQADFPDLRQELLQDILARMPKFNGSRAGAKTFISRLIDHRIADIIEHRCAGCRDHQREESSLDDWVRDELGKWQTQGALTDEDRGKAHRGISPRSRQERAELILDVHEVVDSLPPDLRDLVEHLLRSETVVGIARVTGLSSSTLYRRLEQIRVRFREAGLDGYL
ncbi:MAG: sigma-70 family RNA polymerase sigma factor [Phycisphaeraceae bacterium]|nr:sigma-70 family RNA polymerase sigma factor [Phycisphaeraceae bacterium]